MEIKKLDSNGYRVWSKDWRFWVCILTIITAGTLAWANLTNRMTTVEAGQIKQQTEISALSQNVINLCVKFGVEYKVPVK